jgi:hypothetical protein
MLQVTKCGDLSYACTQRTLTHSCTPRFIFKYCPDASFIHISFFRYFYKTLGVFNHSWQKKCWKYWASKFEKSTKKQKKTFLPNIFVNPKKVFNFVTDFKTVKKSAKVRDKKLWELRSFTTYIFFPQILTIFCNFRTFFQNKHRILLFCSSTYLRFF